MLHLRLSYTTHQIILTCLFSGTLVGPVQEPASHQEQEGEDISRALNLEEVVQESSNEWQSIGNVFR